MRWTRRNYAGCYGIYRANKFQGQVYQRKLISPVISTTAGSAAKQIIDTGNIFMELTFYMRISGTSKEHIIIDGQQRLSIVVRENVV